MRIYEITILVEADDDADADAVNDDLIRAICPDHPPRGDHVCPRGWMTMKRELEPEEAAQIANNDFLNR